MKLNRTAHRGVMHQCRAINRNGKRCTKDVTHQIGEVGYCETHHRMEIEKRIGRKK